MRREAIQDGCEALIWASYCDRRYCQLLVVAYPRKQRYLHPRFFGAGEFVCKVDEGSKFAEQLDPEVFIIGERGVLPR